MTSTELDTGVSSTSTHPELDAYWMPFTSNRRYKQNPRIFNSASGMYYFSADGKKILDSAAGLWCVNAGHCRPEISEAIARQARELDYAPSFQLGHPLAFEFANRLKALAPANIDHVFFTNSGSEAVDTALKMALAYHKAKGQPGRVRLIGRERAYHGVSFGGVSVGGVVGHRRPFGNLLHSVDHLPHTYNREQAAYSKGLPNWGAHLADELLNIIQLHDASTIAAVIVEPVAGSTGVLVPPAGYLQRLREICDQYGILLIFDEVITAFGRLGRGFASDYFGVTPDLITCAKGMTNGAVPMGAVLARDMVYQAFMQGPIDSIEFPHGYTYSGHPLACAAGIATLDVYEQDGLFERAATLETYWQDAAHNLRGSPHVVDIRNLGLLAAVELEPIAGKPGRRAYECHLKCLERGVMIRSTGDTMVLSPPLIVARPEIDQMFDVLSDVLDSMA
jgi:beta-alanine--pyruvate transaminase